MLFGFLRRKNKLSKKQFSEAKEKFSKMIIPHWDEFQKIIKANLKGFDQFMILMRILMFSYRKKI